MSIRPWRRQPVVRSQQVAGATAAIGIGGVDIAGIEVAGIDIAGIEGCCFHPSKTGALEQRSIELRGTRPCFLPFWRT